MNDMRSFDEISLAFNLLHFSSENQKEIFRIVAAIAHLRNLNFKKLACPGSSQNEDEKESCTISVSVT